MKTVQELEDETKILIEKLEKQKILSRDPRNKSFESFDQLQKELTLLFHNLSATNVETAYSPIVEYRNWFKKAIGEFKNLRDLNKDQDKLLEKGSIILIQSELNNSSEHLEEMQDYLNEVKKVDEEYRRAKQKTDEIIKDWDYFKLVLENTRDVYSQIQNGFNKLKHSFIIKRIVRVLFLVLDLVLSILLTILSDFISKLLFDHSFKISLWIILTVIFFFLSKLLSKLLVERIEERYFWIQFDLLLTQMTQSINEIIDHQKKLRDIVQKNID